MYISFHPCYVLDLPIGHRFPMAKYHILNESLCSGPLAKAIHFIVPPSMDDESIVLTHDNEYINQLNNLSIAAKDFRPVGFPLSEAVINREKIIINGTYLAAMACLANKHLGFNIAGGTHHAFANRGEGFCIFNDMAVAANKMIFDKVVENILIIDLDVHQGNGTAALFKENKQVFTFSMHGAGNFPFRKENSDLDIALPDGTPDAVYLPALAQGLDLILDQFNPDFIFYQAGVDTLVQDVLGKLSLTMEGLKKRDELVFSTAKKLGIPICTTMGGGYASELNLIVQAHLQTFDVAQLIFN
jgi:acetoin utilization deacetylase AcuC-like enzyme